MEEASKRENNNKVLQKVQLLIEEGNFYEAQQLTKTIYFRHYSRKNIAEAKQVLLSGAITMLNSKQINCASELGKLLLNIYLKDQLKVDKENLEPIITIANLYPSGNKEKISFLKLALKWASTEEEMNLQKQLYALLGRSFAEMEDFPNAQSCYIRGDNPEEFAKVLLTWLRKGYPGEYDLFLARAVLLYLSTANLRDANEVFTFVTQSLKINTPLVNFIRFLLLTLERDAHPLFEILKQKYAPSLSRDPTLLQYLDHIAEVFFRIRPQNQRKGPGGPGFGNFFSDFLKNMLSGDPASEEAD